LWREVAGLARRSRRGEVGGAGGADEPGGGEAARDQAAVGKPADPPRDVVAFLEQVDEAVVEGELDLDPRVAREELGQHRAEVEKAEGHRCVDLEPAARLDGVARGGELGLLDLLDDPGAVVAVDRAHLGQRETPGGAVEQPHAQPLLQRGHVLARGRLGQAELPGCGGEAAQLRHAHEHRHAVQTVQAGLPSRPSPVAA